MATEWYVRRGKGISGPVSAAQLRTAAQSGELKLDDLVSSDREEWLRVKRVKWLVDLIPNFVRKSLPLLPIATPVFAAAEAEELPEVSKPETEWYFLRDGTPQGPVSWDGLLKMAKSGQLLPNDLIGEVGGEWIEARSEGFEFSASPEGADEDSLREEESELLVRKDPTEPDQWRGVVVRSGVIEFLGIFFAIFLPAHILHSIVYACVELRDAPALTSGIKVTIGVVFLTDLFVGSYGFWIGIEFLKKRTAALIHLRRLLILNIARWLLFTCVWMMASSSWIAAGHEAVRYSNLLGIALSAFWCVVWLVFLARSIRVATTYGDIGQNSTSSLAVTLVAGAIAAFITCLIYDQYGMRGVQPVTSLMLGILVIAGGLQWTQYTRNRGPREKTSFDELRETVGGQMTDDEAQLFLARLGKNRKNAKR